VVARACVRQPINVNNGQASSASINRVSNISISRASSTSTSREAVVNVVGGGAKPAQVRLHEFQIERNIGR
jgi:hypothetical protein